MKRLLYFAIGLACALLATEVVLRALPVATGFHFLPVNAANPVLRGTPLASYSYSKDWNFRFARSGRLNDDGFIAEQPYGNAGPNVLLIGDSYVQAAAVDPAHNLGGLLGKRLDGHKVLALGESGGSLADYLAIADWGSKRYRPDAVMFLLVAGDILDAYQPHSGGHALVDTGGALENRRQDKPALSRVEAMMNRVMVFRYFFDNLGFTSRLPTLRPAAVRRWLGITPEGAARIERAGKFALARLQTIAPKRGLLLLVDAKREPGIGERDIDRFADLAERQGFQVLRLQEAFDRYQRETGLRLDLKPIDGHWNAQAQVVAAEAVLPRLTALLGQVVPNSGAR